MPWLPVTCKDRCSNSISKSVSVQCDSIVREREETGDSKKGGMREERGERGGREREGGTKTTEREKEKEREREEKERERGERCVDILPQLAS